MHWHGPLDHWICSTNLAGEWALFFLPHLRNRIGSPGHHLMTWDQSVSRPRPWPQKTALWRKERKGTLTQIIKITEFQNKAMPHFDMPPPPKKVQITFSFHFFASLPYFQITAKYSRPLQSKMFSRSQSLLSFHRQAVHL